MRVALEGVTESGKENVERPEFCVFIKWEPTTVQVL